MYWVVLFIFIIIGIGWIILKVFESISDAQSSIQNHRLLKEERNKKYDGRYIDASKSLFDRNKDIIGIFENNIKAHPAEDSYSRGRRYSYKSYYIENQTRDCINEIGLAENNFSIRPNVAYLSDWKIIAPNNWVKLSEQIETLFRDRQRNLIDDEHVRQLSRETEIRKAKEKQDMLKKIDRQIEHNISTLNSKIKHRMDPLILRNVDKRGSRGDIFIEDLSKILKPDTSNWILSKESIATNLDTTPFPLFKSNLELKSIDDLNERIGEFNDQTEKDKSLFAENKKYFTKIIQGYNEGLKEDIIHFFNYVLDSVELPDSMPKEWSLDFDPEQRIAIVEISLPDVVHSKIFKQVKLKEKTASKPLNQKEIKEEIPKIHPAIILRIAYEIYKNDKSKIISLLVINGWVEFNDPATGTKTRTYTASLVVERDQIMHFNLKKLDPLVAFLNLKGKSAGKLIDIIPVTPIMSLDKKDKRFIETKEVLNKLGSETNLASMDWQDFESLIAELFEKEFAKEGVEVKVTQASRDRGVDAIAFDPDPIKGGKFVIQAKRYTNTVDVSAVRDLCAVVKKEGASRGILVTTSTYGADAYAFAQNEPITLLNGAELLGLLNKHGYKFRIDLNEARRLNLIDKNNLKR